MWPILIYNTKITMQDGTEPDLTLGQKYKVDCSFTDEEGYLTVSVLNDKSMVHTFNTNEKWFDRHFTLLGDTDLVMEQV